MELGGGLRARLTGYRDAESEDLVKIHLVETEVEAERRPDNGITPLDAFVAEARNFPHYFHDTTWLVEDEAGEPVGAAAAWYREGADPEWLEGDIWVRRPWRRRGLGTRLLGLIADAGHAGSRPNLLGYTTDCAPAGEPFARRYGGVAVRTSRRSALDLRRLDWGMVQSWVDDGPRRAPGYDLDFVEGPYPEEHWDDAVALRLIMNTAPHDDIEMAHREYTRDQVAPDDAFILDGGRTRWTYFARHVASRECVGGTNVTFAPWDRSSVEQGDTAVHPDHRGHALGKWLKAAMLLRIREHLPHATEVRTGNAYSNAPMLGINDALGFEVTRTLTEWKFDVPTLRERLRRA